MAHGQTWNGAGPDDNWTTAGAGGNWSGAAAPVSSATTALIFDGTTRLTPNNDNPGTFTLSTLEFAAGAGAYTLGGNPLSFIGTTRSITSNTSANVTINQSVSYSGTGTIAVTANGGGSITFNGPTTTFSAVNFNQGTFNLHSNTTTISSLTLGNGIGATVVDTGTRTLTLNGSITYDGGSSFTGTPGVLRGIINLSDGIHQINVSRRSNNSANGYDLVIPASFTGNSGAELHFGPVSQGYVVLTGQSNYTGPTFIMSSTPVYLGIHNALPTTSAINFFNGGSLSLSVPTSQTVGNVVAGDYNHQFKSLSSNQLLAGEIRFGDTSTLTVGDATSSTFQGFFTQYNANATPTLNKVGTGTLTLTGWSTIELPGVFVAFSGNVNVNEGTLAVRTFANGLRSGTGRGVVTVNTNGTLSGNGPIIPDRSSQAANLVTIHGTVSPDSASSPIGNLLIGAAAAKSTVTINGTYRVDLLANGASDTLTINGSLALGANSILNAIGITSTPGGGSFVNYTLATFDSGSQTGTFDVTNSLLPAGSTLQYNPASIVLVVPVPEPGTILGLSALTLAGAGFIRRRFTSRRVSPCDTANTASPTA